MAEFPVLYMVDDDGLGHPSIISESRAKQSKSKPANATQLDLTYEVPSKNLTTYAAWPF